MRKYGLIIFRIGNANVPKSAAILSQKLRIDDLANEAELEKI